MRFGASALMLCSCVIAQPKHNGIAVFIDAVPEASGVSAALGKKLVREGYGLSHDSENARIALRIEQRSVIDRELSPGSAGTYILEVTKGKLAGKQIQSFDIACRNMPEPPFECHADTFLRELTDSGVLREESRPPTRF
jgi:hypothetical protein